MSPDPSALAHHLPGQVEGHPLVLQSLTRKSDDEVKVGDDASLEAEVAGLSRSINAVASSHRPQNPVTSRLAAYAEVAVLAVLDDQVQGLLGYEVGPHL